MCAEFSHVPPGELSLIASFQSGENVVCRGQHGKKPKTTEKK